MSVWASNDRAAAQERAEARSAAKRKATEESKVAEKKYAEFMAERDKEHLPILAEMIKDLQAAEKARKDEAPKYNAAVRAYQELDAKREAKRKELSHYVSEHYGEAEFGHDGSVLSDTYWDRWGRVVIGGEAVDHRGQLSPVDHPRGAPRTY